MMEIEKIEKILLNIYSKETCYPKCRDNWNDNNKTLGHCAIVSLIINDYFGGKIYKIKVDGIGHYYNVIDDKVVDLTASQFSKKLIILGKLKRKEMK